MKIADLNQQGVLSASQVEILEKLASSKGVKSVLQPTELSREKLWSLAPASVEIVTEVLDGVDKSPGETSPLERWMARIGKVLWLFVEASVPRRPFYHVFRYWFQILFTITTIVLILTMFNIWEDARPVALKIEFSLIAIYAITETIRGLIARRTDVILNTAGTVSLVIGAMVLAYMSVVNSVDLRSLMTEQSRFTWTLFGLLFIPTFFAILAWSFRNARSNWKAGTATLVLGTALVLAMAKFSGLNDLYFGFAWTTFAMFVLPSLGGLIARAFPSTSYSKKILPISEDDPSLLDKTLRFATGVLVGAVVILYATSMVGLGAYLYLNPKSDAELQAMSTTSLTLPDKLEKPETRKPSNTETTIKDTTNYLWNKLGWNDAEDPVDRSTL